VTYEEFCKLRSNGSLKSEKIYARQKDEFECSYIHAFVWNCKYYLARYTERRYSAWSNAPRWGKSVKEFNTKEHANAYFRKCSVGFERI